MKIIHTSDWHLGQNFYKYDRQEEHRHFFRQLETICKEENADALVVSGDIYHSSNPSSSVKKLFTEAVLSIHRAAPDMKIIITAGNHDSGSLLEAESALWQLANVFVIGGIYRKTQINLPDSVDLDRHIININDKGYVIAVPHSYSQNFPDLTGDTALQDRQGLFFQALQKRCLELSSEKPVVMTAHLTVTGCDRRDKISDNGIPDSIGGIDSADLKSFGVDYDYLALGHIHKPQNIGRKARYCGSPLPLNFSETWEHSVSIVNLERHGELPEIYTRKLDVSLPVVTIPETPLPFEEVLEIIRNLPDNIEAYLRVNVLSDDYLTPDCEIMINEALQDKKYRYCLIFRNRTERTDETSITQDIDIEKVKSLSPTEIAKLYFMEKEGRELDDNLVGLLDEIVKEIENNRI